MFTIMVSHLCTGKIPEPDTIKPRLAAALIKKMAVIRQPYSFWSSDTKSNPDTKHMLWAAILLQDKENYGVITGILAVEYQERAGFQQRDTGAGNSDPSADDLVAGALSGLLDLSRGTAVEKEVRRRVERVAGLEILQLVQKT